jgi:hypothetical protein
MTHESKAGVAIPPSITLRSAGAAVSVSQGRQAYLG